MSMLHSLYAFGVFCVVVIGTLFLKFVGDEHWMYLTMFFAALPIVASILFMLSPMPDMSTSETSAVSQKSTRRTIGIALCVGCIFLGSCAENAMSNWISGFMEAELQIDKAIGDIFGMAMFAILLGITRICYAKWGKNICKMLLIGMIGATVCYLVAGFSTHIVPAFIACILTGIFTSMLWPGTLIMMEEKIPNAGVAAFALMAAGGDLGAAVGPQLLGIVVDRVAASDFFAQMAVSFNLSAEQLGLKVGMLTTALFPIVGIAVVLVIMRHFKKAESGKPASAEGE